MLIREIPYNYTSFSDKEIVVRFLGERMWNVLEALRSQRRTGVSARMLMEVLGDIWIINRNPILHDELMENPKRLDSFMDRINKRLLLIDARSERNPLVLELLEECQAMTRSFKAQFTEQRTLREKALAVLSRVTRQDNIDFSVTGRVSHVTDATDWRVEYPFVVISPDREEEVSYIVRDCIALGLSIIPRGGGTGYTGSAIPLHPNTAIINTEKLTAISDVEYRSITGYKQKVASIKAEAGAVTRHVSDRVKTTQSGDYVFAVDPTSQNACTIGGNVAMNAGGKKAVQWGTCLDNLISWRMVTPQAEWIEVERTNHNLGKIHDIAEATFKITRFDISGRKQLGEPTELRIPANQIRKPGLGKDVTNKFLGGLPGVQKEGCDGIVTSAILVVHRMPNHIRTLCLEFFGTDLSEAVPAIVETKEFLDKHPTVGCAGLEHLDERYVKAVGYGSKNPRRSLPKMVLLADVISDDEQALEKACTHIQNLAQERNGEAFVAITPEARNRFWKDRTRTAAIAAHTNAFKINEDVVIPLDQLAKYSEEIERINIEHSIQNKIEILDRLTIFFEKDQFRAYLPQNYPASDEGHNIVNDKIVAALNLLNTTRDRWKLYLEQSDSIAEDHSDLLLGDSATALRPSDTLMNLMLRRDLVISYKKEVRNSLIEEIFNGDTWREVRRKLDEMHATIRSGRLFVALHMHAGDGNIHTNIPVNSNDYTMLQKAEHIVHKVMQLAKDLGGAISGEHGTGLTKQHYLDPKIIEAFADYKRRIDPDEHFNKGKLMPGSGLANAYTPSLRLVQQEALLLHESELGALNDDIRNCLRCGKCKPVCTTHVPQASLLYSPRNKILTAGLIIEAFLFAEQTRTGLDLHHTLEFNELADHCTICHRCVTPCPVNIDFGKVTIRMREILTEHQKRVSSFAGKGALHFLTTTHPARINLSRSLILKPGYAGQRLAHSLARRFLNPSHSQKSEEESIKHLPAPTNRKPSLAAQVKHLLATPLPWPLAKNTMRSQLGLENSNSLPIIRNTAKTDDSSDAVFYFPGCGCERLYSDISMAVLAALYHLGTSTVIPPGYLCCGFPQRASGDSKQGRSIITHNRVLFHRIAAAVKHMNIKTVLVSCGTCLDQLTTYRFKSIFPGCRLMDIHEYLMEKGLTLPNDHSKQNFLYHDPCHSPSKHHNPLTVAETLLSGKAHLSDRCCGEAGTFSVSRPDIATQARYRKELEIKHGVQELLPKDPSDSSKVQIYTACPSCVQGLYRYRKSTGVHSDFLILEVARRLFGEKWQETIIPEIQEQGIQEIIL
ncbi:MAG: DUF3683 domain-containing protein [Magnetococcales bacterium]|nr:DUF3683 domain-containing protein [Magnetococcales bacterium]